MNSSERRKLCPLLLLHVWLFRKTCDKALTSGGKKQSLLTSQESILQGRSSTLTRWWLCLWQAEGPKKAAGLAGSWYQASSFCSIKLDYLSVFNQLWKCMILDVKCKGKCSLLGKDKNGMKSNDPNQTWGAFFSKSFFWDNKLKKKKKELGSQGTRCVL